LLFSFKEIFAKACLDIIIIINWKKNPQSSSQISQVVSGRDTIGSGNNINVQNQENTGNNALAQS
jgi:hypothetical protein